ncbi:MAG: RNA methyltransferase [Betaproteobacteria bacterium]
MSFESLAARTRFVLVEPSHPGNIGAAARALKTMGFGRLEVVAPRFPDYRSHPEAVAFATAALDVLEASRAHDTLAQALAGVSHAVAMTGYDRLYGPPLAPLRESALQARAQLERAGAGEIAYVFGTERSGLENAHVDLCQACAAIPANPAFASLNLAQAVQVAAYEAQLALRGAGGLQEGQRRFEDDAPATVAAIEGLYAHLELAMTQIGVHDPAEPKFLMPRLRRLFARAGLTMTEVDLRRGVCAAIVQPRAQRAGRKSSGRAP